MDEVDVKINNLKEVIRKTPVDVLQERIYVCLANGCILLTAFKTDKGKIGWSSKLHDELNQPMLNSKEQKTIEKAFANAPWIMDVFNENLKSPQKGGSILPNLVTAGSSFIKPLPLPSLTAQDISLDEMFDTFIKKTNDIDNFWGKIAYETPGFLKKMNDIDDFNIPTPFGRIPISAPPFIMLMMALLDSIRLSLSLSGTKSNLLTLIVLIEELLTGQWRQMILTAAGFLSPSGVAIGIILKYVVNAMMLMSPEIRTQIFKDVIKGGKSAFIGFLLWAATIFPPKKMREELEEILNRLRSTVEGFDDKLKVLQEQGSQALASSGKKIDFTGIDLSNLRKISFQDIQNLQSLAQWDVLVCSSEFQEILSTIESNPMFRLIIELLNIPTTSDDKYKLCGAPPYKSITQKIQIATQPEIVNTILPTDIFKEADVDEDKDAADAADVEAEEKPVEAEEKPVDVEEKPVEAEEKPVEAEEKPVEAEEKPVDVEEKPKKPLALAMPKVKLPWRGGSRGMKGKSRSRKTSIFKLKKSTRNRKSTPRRETRRH